MLDRSPFVVLPRFLSLRVELLLVLGALSACASPQPHPTSAATSRLTPGSCDRARDQQAILAMAGSFRVSFDFEETEVLAIGYEKHVPLHAGGTELVTVLLDSPGRVSLQHVLVVGDGVNKHWRQDWTFEDRELLEFQGHNTWQKRRITADEARCTWTQAVFEVDDSPRYEGFGRFLHEAAYSVWQSNETWRPLPRREYTKRHDYDVLLGLNRHRITRTGWNHEQDNVKLVLDPRHPLVREQGVNRYIRVDASATEIAAKYWQSSGPFWALVRAEWALELSAHDTLRLHTEVSGKRLYEPLFERAEVASDPAVTAAFIHETVAPYVLGASERSAGTP